MAPRRSSAKQATHDASGAAPQAANPAATLLEWYDRHRRVLPWRALPGETPDPYRVWLSEVMLQQTTVIVVADYFREFLSRWPTLEALAKAPLDDVLHAWQGLGYYARARNLHRCAQAVAAEHDGGFPDTEEGLRKLPGIGRYTAAAIAAIAFDRQATVMDGNVERVMARRHAVREPLPDSKPILYDHAATLTPRERPGDYAQAVMDLGATICTPRKPKCMLCPWQPDCDATRQGIAEELPAKSPKPDRPQRYGMAFWLVRSDGAILLRRRPEKGLLGGMMEVPSTDWLDTPWGEAEAFRAAPVGGVKWRTLPGVVRHGFTHFKLEITVAAGIAPKFAPLKDGVWCLPDQFGSYALPNIMKKVVNHALRRA